MMVLCDVIIVQNLPIVCHKPCYFSFSIIPVHCLRFCIKFPKSWASTSFSTESYSLCYSQLTHWMSGLRVLFTNLRSTPTLARSCHAFFSQNLIRIRCSKFIWTWKIVQFKNMSQWSPMHSIWHNFTFTTVELRRWHLEVCQPTKKGKNLDRDSKSPTWW